MNGFPFCKPTVQRTYEGLCNVLYTSCCIGLMHNYIFRFSDLDVEIGEWAFLKYVERKLTVVDLTFSRKRRGLQITYL
jgi:hypothetical protein